MHFLIFTVLASLVICSHAAAILPRQGITNPRLAQFRVFSETGCFRLNQGFYTIDLDQANQCYDLSADSATASPNGYVSIELQAVTVNATALNCHCKFTKLHNFLLLILFRQNTDNHLCSPAIPR